jgi:SAM-dependent methyltransferase
MTVELERSEPSTFAPSHDDVLTGLADARNYNQWLFGRGASHLGRRVLDVGAGIGTFTALAVEAGASVVALEPDGPFARHLRERFADADVHVREADVRGADLDEQLGTFDSIICFNVLEHVDDDVATLARFRDLLAPGGHLLLLVPAHEWLASPFDREVGHERRYRRDELAVRLAAGGLSVEDVRYVNPIGALGWLVSMRLGRRHDLPYGQLRVFDRLVPALRPLDRLPLPFGQSVWAVAQRPA